MFSSCSDRVNMRGMLNILEHFWNDAKSSMHSPIHRFRLPLGCSPLTLPEILLKGVELAGDRRKTGYSRLRKAVENGLVEADALKMRMHPKTEAVDPELSDVMKARMGSGSSIRRRN
jgi:hypothetical protein